MAKLWQDVISQPAYQKLDPDAKERVRQKYFSEVVTPQIKNPEQIEEYRQKFYDKALSLEYPDAAERMQKNMQDQFNSMPPVSKEVADAINKQTEVIKSPNAPENLEQAEKFQQEKQRGVIPALVQGRYGSHTAKYIKTTFPESDAAQGVEDFEATGYQPQNFRERVAYGLGGIIADTPLYMAGGALAGAPGAFGLAQGAGKIAEIKDQKEDVFNKHKFGLSDVPETLLETGKGAAVGSVVAGTGMALPFVTPQVTNKIVQMLTNKGIEVSGETAALLAAEAVINGQDPTTEGVLEAAAIMLILKNFKATPASRRQIEKIQAETGITPEQIARNIHPEQIKDLANPETAMKVIDEAKIKTEDQIKAEQTTRMQEQIIKRSFVQNYKPGKTPQEILQVNQIPAEYRHYVVDKVGKNQYRWKPEVLERVNREIETQGEEMFPMAGLPNTLYDKGKVFRDMPDKNKFYDDYLREMERKKAEQPMSLEAQKAFKEQQARLKGMTSPEGKQALIDRLYEEEYKYKTGVKRKYENLPKVREIMDQVNEFSKSVITPEENLRIAADPSTIDRYIDSKESGLDKLKPAHRKAILSEIADEIQSAYNPQAVDKRAMKEAKKKAQIIINQAKHSFKDTQSAWRAIENTEANRPKSRTKFEQEKAAILREEAERDFQKIDNEYDQMRLENATLMQRAMGQAESYGTFSHDNRAFYGGEHFRDMMEFSTKSDAEVAKDLNSAYFLKREYRQEGYHPDRFLNKSRFIAKMGRAVDRIFNKPIKQAMHNSIVETESLRAWVKDNIKTFDAKARKEIGVYLVSLQGQGRGTIQAMNDRMLDRARPRNYMKLAPEQRIKIDEQLMKKLDGKLIKVKELEQFTPEQQKAIKDIQELMEVMFDRINSAREAAGIDPIQRVDDYFTFIRKFKVIEELGWSPYEGTKELFEIPDIEQFHTKGFSSQFFKSRKDSYKDIEFDAGYVLDTYLASTIKACHMTPVIGKLRAGLENAEKMALENPFAHKYLHETLDYVSGKKISTAMKGLDAAANMINRNIGLFILPFNVASAIIQPTALVNTIGKIGGVHTAKGLKDFGSQKMRQFATEHSKELRQRMHDVVLQDDIHKGVTGKISMVREAAGTVGTWPLRFLDLQTATITWLSGYRLGMEKFAHLEPKAREREAIYFADDLVVNTQGSAARIDLAPIQHTPLGKSLTLFNTFVINNLNYYIDDLAGLRKVYKEGKAINVGTKKEPEYLIKAGEGERLFSKQQAVKHILMYTAAAAVANTMYELMGVDSPLPSPVSAFYKGVTGEPLIPSLNPLAPDEKSRKEAQLEEGLRQALCEFASILPVAGGSPRYGGASLGGATWNLWYDTAQAISGHPGSKTIFGEFDNEKVSDNMPYLIMKWAGVPGGQQIYKLLKMYDKVQKKEKEERKRRLDPAGYREREYRKAHPEIREREKRMKELRGR